MSGQKPTHKLVPEAKSGHRLSLRRSVRPTESCCCYVAPWGPVATAPSLGLGTGFSFWQLDPATTGDTHAGGSTCITDP